MISSLPVPQIFLRLIRSVVLSCVAANVLRPHSSVAIWLVPSDNFDAALHPPARCHAKLCSFADSDALHMDDEGIGCCAMGHPVHASAQRQSAKVDPSLAEGPVWGLYMGYREVVEHLCRPGIAAVE